MGTILRKLSITFFCLLISLPSMAASVSSRDTLVVDGELIKADSRNKQNKAWGQSTVEIQADGKAKIVAVSQQITMPELISPHLNDKPIVNSKTQPDNNNIN